MTLDIRGSKKTTGISDNQFVVLEELLSNSIDSYLIRKHFCSDIDPLEVIFDISLYKKDLFSNSNVNLTLTCTDNGAGMANDQVKAFVTKDSTFKDDLKINGIGKCFGSGRVQFFHFFNNFSIESIYEENKKIFVRKLKISSDDKEITENCFDKNEIANRDFKTSFKFSDLSDEAYKKHFLSKDLRAEFSAKNVKHHILSTFLQRFITLRGIAGQFKIYINSEFDKKNLNQEIIDSADLPKKFSEKSIKIKCIHGYVENTKEYNLKISTYKFPEIAYPGFVHDVALCANSSIVKSLTNKFLKVRGDRSRSINENYYLILIESDYLESKVNIRRDGFDIHSNCRNGDIISKEPSMEDITDSIEDFILEILTPTDFDRQALIEETGYKFGISPVMLAETRVKVKYGDSADMIAKRVLKKYQEEIIDDTSSIFDLKKHLLDLDPRKSDFRNHVNAISWKYTSTIKKMDMANLSQLVVRRSAMLDVLRYAVDGLLSLQENSNGRKENEKIIHNIFFPMGKDSNENVDHDIWILNEEYHYFSHIASDKSLASIPWNETENIFDSDIDSELEKVFKKNNQENRLKRPDIAIFNQEGSAIIIELKAPGVELQDHIFDLQEYSRLLAAKSKGRINKFYGYLIGDTINENRMDNNYTKFASGNGYFHTVKIKDFDSGIQYGDLYVEVLFYRDFIDRAEQRLKIYKEKLGIA
ncbi:MAG: hypothetical protein P1U57_10335 [Oleibacter sp.]|nr:hypothetical protein [Thalassolituus sp.]